MKGLKIDLDQPQVGRQERQTPVEQGFGYATGTVPGIDWVIISNFREIRLYKNGYIATFHRWFIEDLIDQNNLFEFYAILRPVALISDGINSFSMRLFKHSIQAGHVLTEGFYSLYKSVQSSLISVLRTQPPSKNFTVAQLFGKTHKLLNRILFAAFCEDHPANLLPDGTLKRVASWAAQNNSDGGYWKEYLEFFDWLNVGGGKDGIAFNAFNGGLFRRDEYFSKITLPNEMFTTTYVAGKGRRKSLEIDGIFGFDVYDFADDLNERALGAIFEQSLKDIPKGAGSVRGVGEVDVSLQNAGGVYYTPTEITTYMISRAMELAFDSIETNITSDTKYKEQLENINKLRIGPKGRKTSAEVKRHIIFLTSLIERLELFRVLDPACGSGAYLVDLLVALRREYEKVNLALAELRGDVKQMSLSDLDRQILRSNLHGQDVLEESIEISKLSIWLRTAQKGEKLEGLKSTIRTVNSLRQGEVGSYDVVIGNPPWGADLEGWTKEELARRFPDIGNERDSFAVFIKRADEFLKPNGILAYVLPNSWLTVSGYSSFRRWLLLNFEIIEIVNIWKIFDDVNLDACILIARKRSSPIVLDAGADSLTGDRSMCIRAISRGLSESEKLKCEFRFNPARHSDAKPATYSDLMSATVPILSRPPFRREVGHVAGQISGRRCGE